MRYTCYKCKTEHGEDNMVAYCAACCSSEKSRADAAAAKLYQSELEKNVLTKTISDYVLTIKNLEAVCEHHKTAAAEHEANEDKLAKELAEAKADANTYAKSADKWKHDYEVLNAVRHLESLPRLRECQAKLEQAEADLKEALEGQCAACNQAKASAEQAEAEVKRLQSTNASLRETIGKYSDERSSVRDILLAEMDGVKDRELTLNQQVAKMANLLHYARAEARNWGETYERTSAELRKAQAEADSLKKMLNEAHDNLSDGATGLAYEALHDFLFPAPEPKP